MNKNLDLARLIELIEAEVVKVLKNEGYIVNQSLSADDKRKHNILVIVTEGSIGRDEAVKQIEKLAKSCNVTLLLSQIAAKIFGTDRFSQIAGLGEVFTDDSNFDPPDTDFSRWVSTMDLVVVPLLSFSTAAKLSLGIADSLSTNVILHFLMQNKPVIAARNSVELPDLAPVNPFVKLGTNYLSKLEDFGIRLVDVSKIAVSAINYANGRLSYEGNVVGRTVVSSSVISSLAEDVRELIVDDSAIVTHLAKEIANEHGIKIVNQLTIDGIRPLQN